MANTVHRIEIHSRPGYESNRGDVIRHDAETMGMTSLPSRIDTSCVYLVEGDLDDRQVQRLASELLADPVSEDAVIGAAPPKGDTLIEVHPLPGVMDPQSESIELAVQTLLETPVTVRTGARYDLHGTDTETAELLARRCLANPVVQAVHTTPYHPGTFPAGTTRQLEVRTVPLRDLNDTELAELSRNGHLFLSLEEMQVIQQYYRKLERDPREIELETLAQTWSEHCVHKTLKATIRYRGQVPTSPHGDRPGCTIEADGAVLIENLLKSTVAAATHELMADGIDWCLSVFVDNAGIIAFDDEHAVCFKAETHNHPSAIEPYGGAATGIGGCIRDIMGTGLAARPIAATDVFCVADPDRWAYEATADRQQVPAGCLHPRRILSQVVAGVRDYGNRMGIPTLNGAVWFDDDYIGNPLVYCGCIGVMPRDRIAGDPSAGDIIVALGGRTGRDGIHGATFSSAELTDSHADEFSHAVQIGNPVTEKKTLDAILEARDHVDGCLFTSITDCGAGGFSSAVGEMGETLGATVHLDRAPLKYDGLSPTEVWISEAQERMVLAVPSGNLNALRAICAMHDVEMCELGTFGTPDGELELFFDGTEVGRLSMDFMHNGLPNTTREASWTAPATRPAAIDAAPKHADALLGLLGHRNIASKHWIIRQYDHEVQGGAVVSPLVGPAANGPSDAAVISPVPGSTRGLAIGNGMATGWRDDPYAMALAAIDECVRNLVCVGADPTRIAILDNFCWPGCGDEDILGTLVRASLGCYDGAKAYRTPFISGKDSLNNQFSTDDGRRIRIPPTLLISGFGIVTDINRCCTMNARKAGHQLLLIGDTTDAMGGSHYQMLFGNHGSSTLPLLNLQTGPAAAQAVATMIAQQHVVAAHDASEGGVLLAAAEMAFAGGVGLAVDLSCLGVDDLNAACFAETPGRYLLEVDTAASDAIKRIADQHGVPVHCIGAFNDTDRFCLDSTDLNLPLATLLNAWREPLDW